MLLALVKADRTLEEAGRDMCQYPQVLINVKLADREGWKSNNRLSAACKAGEERLDGSGRVLLRPSGNEPVLRVMVEGEDGALVRTLAEDIAATAV